MESFTTWGVSYAGREGWTGKRQKRDRGYRGGWSQQHRYDGDQGYSHKFINPSGPWSAGEVRKNSKVMGVHLQDGQVVSVDVETNGKIITEPCDYLLSSMPIKDLVAALHDTAVPKEVKSIASELPYRDFITVGLLVKKLNIVNTTKIHTF